MENRMQKNEKTVKWVVSDILTLTKRNLIRYTRIPQLLVFSSIQSVMFLLLFTYVFGGAIQVPGGGSYINYLIPGILIQTVMFGAIQTGLGLAEDLNKGLIDRFRSLPMARSAVLAGRTISDMIRNVFVVTLMATVGALIGFRFQQGWLHGIGALLLAVLFGFAFSWVSAVIGLAVKNPETAQVAGFIWVFPLVFASSAFVPVDSMPYGLRVFAEHSPITMTINTVRTLTLAGNPGDYIWQSLAWTAAILIIFVPIAVRLYRKSS